MESDITKDIVYSEEAVEIIRKSVENKLNIMVVGHPGTGKTTIIKNMIDMIKPSDSVCILEDGNELNYEHIKHDKVTRYEIDAHRGGCNTWKHGIESVMKIVPDYCIVEEVRGDEAYQLLEPMLSGYRGFIISMFSDSAEDAINGGYATLVYRGGWEFTKEKLYEYIAQAFDMVICVDRGIGKERRIDHICVIDGLKYDKNGEIDGVNITRIWEV